MEANRLCKYRINAGVSMERDSLNIVVNQVQSGTESGGYTLYLLIGICLVIALLTFLWIHHNKSAKMKKKKELLSENEVDFKGIIDSSFKAKPLYDELKKKCHPDLYRDEALNKEATEIFQLLVKYKYDYKKLSELKERAITNLKI